MVCSRNKDCPSFQCSWNQTEHWLSATFISIWCKRKQFLSAGHYSKILWTSMGWFWDSYLKKNMHFFCKSSNLCQNPKLPPPPTSFLPRWRSTTGRRRFPRRDVSTLNSGAMASHAPGWPGKQQGHPIVFWQFCDIRERHITIQNARRIKYLKAQVAWLWILIIQTVKGSVTQLELTWVRFSLHKQRIFKMFHVGMMEWPWKQQGHS